MKNWAIKVRLTKKTYSQSRKNNGIFIKAFFIDKDGDEIEARLFDEKIEKINSILIEGNGS